MTKKAHTLLVAVILLLSFWVTSCNSYVIRPLVPERQAVFPPPPDSTRIQFLTHFSGSEDLKAKRSGFYHYLFGDEEPLSIIKPYGITVKGSTIYICDTGIPAIVVMDLSERTFEYFIPDGRGQLQLPVNCYVDERGQLYVADANRRQVVVFDRDRNYIGAFGEDEGFKPTDVLMLDGRIYVANVEGHSILTYDSEEFSLLGESALYAPGEKGYIRQATNMAVSGGQLYVSDFGDFNVKRITPEGTVTAITGGYGNTPGTFTRPKGIALDRDANLYVVDAAFENIQIFNEGGMLLMHFGGSYEGPGAMWLPAAVEISYENLSFFESYVNEDFELKYLIYVTNQYGPAKVNVYGFVQERGNTTDE